ncbi:hypothetical protein ACNR9Q_11635 [Maribacter sp. X9]|uniref:hypothetical protein n=1 Tax=Maribacter sp. X9 TaxID=3402159 RepID=UPI003AF39B4E
MITHLFLVLGLGGLTLYVILKINSFNAENSGETLFLYVVPILALIGYFGSQLLFRKSTTKINPSIPLEDKLKKYQFFLLLKYALIEFPALIGLFTYYNSGNALPLVISICLLAYFAVQRPTKENIIKWVPLTQKEQMKIQQI